MNLILAITICAGLDLYFLKDSPDLLVRITPEVQTEKVTLYYSFSDTNWDSMVVEQQGQFFDAIVRSPDTLNLIGIYYVYDNGDVEDNNGLLYLYEIKIFPKMLMPFAMSDLEVVIEQAKKKILSGVHVDEAVMLLDYVDNILAVVPIIKDGDTELKRNLLRSEADKLRELIGK